MGGGMLFHSRWPKDVAVGKGDCEKKTKEKKSFTARIQSGPTWKKGGGRKAAS